MNFKMTIAYDGTDYNGWQKQNNTKNTLQERLELVLSKLCGTEIELYGSGRTDAGAHAMGQVANFHTDMEFEPQYIKDYVNTFLPSDIAVLEVQKVNDRFHSRLNAKKKTYEYRIQNSICSNVFEQRFMFNYSNPLDVEKMREAAGLFIGEHDFMGFCSNKRYKKSTVRRIYSIDIIKKGDEISLVFCGSGFLYNMVRIMAGTLAEIGEGKSDKDIISQVFLSRDRTMAGVTLPACGLTLVKVEY